MYIGFDLGGTKMLACLFDETLQLRASLKVKTPSHEGPEAVATQIGDLVLEVMNKAGHSKRDLHGLGVAVPGVIDFEAGIVKQAPNLGMRDFPLAKTLGKRFSVPVLLENDVNAGTWGEYRLGAARGYQHVLGVFPGTGIGGGLIFGGRLYRGAGGGAGEVGHMIIQPGGALCGCGQQGCLEAVASRKALSKDALGYASAGVLPDGFDEYGTDLSLYTSSFFKKALKAQVPEIEAVVHRGARYLGMGIANLVNLLNPECIVIGGGLAEKLKSRYISLVERSMREHAMGYPAEQATLVAAELGDNAVTVGAALLVSEAQHSGPAETKRRRSNK